MSLEWSFSTDRRIRRCQRQFFFGSVAAWHNAKDPLRRESFLLSQVKSMDAWRGNLVHEAIRSFVMPPLQARQAVPWERVIQEARNLGARNGQAMKMKVGRSGRHQTAGAVRIIAGRHLMFADWQHALGRLRQVIFQIEDKKVAGTQPESR